MCTQTDIACTPTHAHAGFSPPISAGSPPSVKRNHRFMQCNPFLRKGLRHHAAWGFAWTLPGDRVIG